MTLEDDGLTELAGILPDEPVSLPTQYQTIDSADIVICQLRSQSTVKVPVKVHGKQILAVLDTAAEVNIISDRLLHELSQKPEIVKEVTMHAAGRNMKMKGMLLEPIPIEIGDRRFHESVYVAPIEDDMLIGLDFMLRHNATINLGGAYLEMGKEIVPIITGNNKSTETVKVAKVTVKKRAVVPAFSVLRIACSISQPLSEYIVEPTVQSTLVLGHYMQKTQTQSLVSSTAVING